jgi:hypothetical protein
MKRSGERMSYKLGKKWMAQVNIDGQKVRKRFETKAEAKVGEIEQKDRILNPEKQIRSVSLLEWGTGYLEFALQKFSSKVFNEKKNVFRLLVNRFGADTPVSALTLGLVLGYCQKELKKRSGHSVNKDLDGQRGHVCLCRKSCPIIFNLQTINLLVA